MYDPDPEAAAGEHRGELSRKETTKIEKRLGCGTSMTLPRALIIKLSTINDGIRRLLRVSRILLLTKPERSCKRSANFDCLCQTRQPRLLGTIEFAVSLNHVQGKLFSTSPVLHRITTSVRCFPFPSHSYLVFLHRSRSAIKATRLTPTPGTTWMPRSTRISFIQNAPAR
jgi:hypothetical protein